MLLGKADIVVDPRGEAAIDLGRELPDETRRVLPLLAMLSQQSTVTGRLVAGAA